MTDTEQWLEIARIIEGEAGVCGPVGMFAVALSISNRLYGRGDSFENIAVQYYGRAKPSKCALVLATLVTSGLLPVTPHIYCMGGRVDVEPKGWRSGDVVVTCGRDSVHLYAEWPGKERG